MIIPKKLRYTLMFRWSIATAAPVALFWAAWFLVNGSVPITSFYGFSVPFSMSRWWDVFIGPIVSILTISLLSGPFFEDKSKEGLACCFAISLGGGLIAGIGEGLVFGIFFGVAVALFLALCTLLVVSLGFVKRWLLPMDLFVAGSPSGVDELEEGL